MILRCTEALDKKRRAYQTYRRDGIVKAGEPYIVAISLSKIEDAFLNATSIAGTFKFGMEFVASEDGEGSKGRIERPLAD